MISDGSFFYFSVPNQPIKLRVSTLTADSPGAGRLIQIIVMEKWTTGGYQRFLSRQTTEWCPSENEKRMGLSIFIHCLSLQQ